LIQQGATVGARLEKMWQVWRRVKLFIPWALGGLVVLAGLILVLIYVPKIQVPTGYWLNPKVIFDMENEARRTLAYIIGGLLVFIGIILTFWQIRILGKQLHVAQEGQITERFTRAIEQLGSDKMEIRLGGIYALERIANDSDKDYWPIMETLTAYVRERAPWREPDQKVREEAAGEKAVATATSQMSTDIQAVLTVIGRRKYPDYHIAKMKLLDLRDTNLQRADLSFANLEGVFFSGVNLERAFFYETNLERGILYSANLKRIKFSNVKLYKGKIKNAHLEGADLTGAIGLTREQLAEAIIDENTKLPSYLKE
jgi:hypothetical protein